MGSNPFPVSSNPWVRRDRRCGWHVLSPIVPLPPKSVLEFRSGRILDDGVPRGMRNGDLEIH